MISIISKILFITVLLNIIPGVLFSQQHSIQLLDNKNIPLIDSSLKTIEIESIYQSGDNYILLHRNPNGVSIMNERGLKESVLVAGGRGPFEISRPRYLQIVGNDLYIWDSENLKLSIFTNDFEPNKELRGIRHAINGFSVNHHGQIAVFHQPRFQDEYVHIYEMDQANTLHSTLDLGSLSNEGRTLLFMENTGGLIWNKNDLVWIDPSMTVLFVYNILDNTLKEIPFEDSLFEVEPWNKPDDFNSNTFTAIREYINTNSRVISIRKLNDYILVEIENFINGNSTLTYHLFDQNYRIIGKIDLDEGSWVNYIRGHQDNKLYYWGNDYLETGNMDFIRVREVHIEAG